MALAYPEGECFFQRSVLNTSQADGYHADKVEDFYSHLLVEFVWNQEAYHGSVAARRPGGRSHPRSGYKIVNSGDWSPTEYGAWEQPPFSYGPALNDIKRRFQHNLCTSGGRFKKRHNGGSAEVDTTSHGLSPSYLLMFFSPGSWRCRCPPRKRGVFGLMSVFPLSGACDAIKLTTW